MAQATEIACSCTNCFLSAGGLDGWSPELEFCGRENAQFLEEGDRWPVPSPRWASNPFLFSDGRRLAKSSHLKLLDGPGRGIL